MLQPDLVTNRSPIGIAIDSCIIKSLCMHRMRLTRGIPSPGAIRLYPSTRLGRKATSSNWDQVGNKAACPQAFLLESLVEEEEPSQTSIQDSCLDIGSHG